MFEEAQELVNKSKTIYVVGHENPDGDAIGSSYAICLALRKMGKEANVIMPICSDTFKFLPNIDIAVDNVKKHSYDLLIAVDSSSKERLAITDEDFNEAKKVLMIDHHVIDKTYGDVCLIEPEKPATCEIMYNFITKLGVDIDKDIASYLYLGIVTDTGSFNYSSTLPSTLIIASKLIETGINFSYICQMVNHTMKEGKLRLIAKTIDNMEEYYDGKFRYSYVDYNTIKNLGLDDEESEGMTNYLKTVENTEISAYVRQRSDKTYKVSLRSNGKVDVSKIAIPFGGGGHQRAAGYTMNDELNIGKNKLIDIVGVMLSADTPN